MNPDATWVYDKGFIEYNAGQRGNRPPLPPAAQGPRVLYFPPDHNIGRLLIRPWVGQPGNEDGRAAWSFQAVAQGSVLVPPGYEAKLVVHRRAADDLTPLEAVAPDDLQYLVLGTASGYNSLPVADWQLAHLTHLTGLRELIASATATTPQGLRHIAHLQGLRSLLVRTAKDVPGVHSGDFILLRDLPQLEALHLVDVPLTTPGLGTLPHLRHLVVGLGQNVPHHLERAALHTLRPTLRSLALTLDGLRSDGLREVGRLVELEALALAGTPGWVAPSELLPPTALASLADLSRLRVLELRNVFTASLAPLSTLPHLEVLSLSFSELAVGQGTLDSSDSQKMYVEPALLNNLLADLGTFPGLRQLTFEAEDAHFTHEAVRGMCQADTLQHINLWRCGFIADALADLPNLTSLRTLCLANTSLTDHDMTAIGLLSTLEELDIAATRASDAGVAHLAALHNLRVLGLSGTKMSAASLSTLRHLTYLEDLGLGEIPLDDEAIQLLAAFSRLHTLGFACAPGVQPASLQALQALPALVELSVVALPPNSLIYLVALSNLEWLWINGSELNAADIAALQHLPKLRGLSLFRTSVSDEGWAALGRLKNLRTLSLYGSNIRDKHLEGLIGLTNLRELDLARTQMSDGGLPALSKMTHLEELNISDTEVGHLALSYLPALQQLEQLRVIRTKIDEWGQMELRRRLPNTWT